MEANWRRCWAKTQTQTPLLPPLDHPSVSPTPLLRLVLLLLLQFFNSLKCQKYLFIIVMRLRLAEIGLAQPIYSPREIKECDLLIN